MKQFLSRWMGGGKHVPEPRPSDFEPTHEGWLFKGQPDQDNPYAAYMQQLLEEGRARERQDGVLVPWADLYSVLDDEAHASSLVLLSLPDQALEVPVLISAGSPSDDYFQIVLDAWATPDAIIRRHETRGAVLLTDDGPRLLSRDAYRLVTEVEHLEGTRAGLSPAERMLAMGRIQGLARQCGARMDAYLASTPVVVPETLDLDLRDHEVGGTRIVEVAPRPEGAPERWIEQFDRFQSVRPRYDVTLPGGGMAHVVLPEPVREVAGAIKALPGRRIGGTEAAAFLQNPYPFLGENSEKVLPPERFEQTKRAAGLVEWELDLQPEEQGWGGVLVDPTGERDDEFVGTVDVGQGRELLSAAEAARRTGMGAVRWKGRDIALSGVTLQSLERLAQLSVEESVCLLPDAGEWLDLAHYSDRVVGFDGKVVHVPRIARDDAAGDWTEGEFPPVTIDSIETTTGDVSRRKLAPEDMQELDRRVCDAEKAGETAVVVPGADIKVPTTEARSWIDAANALRKRSPDVQAPREPAPSTKLALRILHNIEELEYAAAAPELPDVQPELEMPRALRPEIQLQNHQREGVAWMQARFRQIPEGIRGVLLADDMGLGKTLQSLCLMAWYRETSPDPRPCLVVAPVSLLVNWKREIEKFLDGSQGKTVTLYGEHLAQYRLTGSDVPAELRASGVRKALRDGFASDAAFVLTTYETLRDFQLSLARERWGIVVCDEAQKIKTPGAMVTRAAKALQAQFRIACTGTPVENTLADLWCLFDFFQPGLLGSLREFTATFRREIELREEGHEERVEALRSQISPWVLRRMKQDVAELPPKKEEPCVLPMSARQRALYSAAINDFRDAMQIEGKERTNAVLGLLHRLRMICANPLAVDRDDADFLSVDEHVAHSPKLAWLLEQLEQVRQKGEKAIVFSEYREIQRLVQQAVASRFGFRPAVVNGSTSVDVEADESRQSIIDAFQAKPGFGVIVLSTTAVGFGVNIQAANHVIHFTRPWNPAKEDQATDRAYRIGQERTVFVYCPTVAGEGFESFEQRVAQRLAAKRSLSTDMLAPEQNIGIEEFADL